MTIAYQQELDLTTSILRRMRLSVHLLCRENSLAVLDTGLRHVIGLHDDYDAALRTALPWQHERTIYKIMDQFMCHYIHLHLPGTAEPTALVIGPYLTVDPTPAMLLEQTERLGLSMQLLQPQADFYASLPVFSDPSVILSIVSCLGEVIWKGPEGFHTVDVNTEQFSSLPAWQPADAPIEQADILQQMKLMEERYAYENQLMEIVSKGLTQEAEMMMSSVSSLNYQSRASDPLRNMKNYCIICNTLLRKAAQNGGVHPLYLDKASGQWAQQIEASPTVEKASGEQFGVVMILMSVGMLAGFAILLPFGKKLMTSVDKTKGGNGWSNVLSGCFMLTLLAVYVPILLIGDTYQALVMITGLFVAIALGVVAKKPGLAWLNNFIMAGSMIVGMVSSLLWTSIF